MRLVKTKTNRKCNPDTKPIKHNFISLAELILIKETFFTQDILITGCNKKKKLLMFQQLALSEAISTPLF